MTILQMVTILLVIVTAQSIFFLIQWRFLLPRILDRYDRYFYSHNDRYPYIFATPLLRIIERAERKSQVNLTRSAREMLVIPVVEVLETEGGIDWDQVDVSIQDIVRTIAEETAQESKVFPMRNSLSVIRAFHRRFCNIPPFCSRIEERR